MRGEAEVEGFFEPAEAGAQIFPIAFSCLDKGRELLELLATNRSLDIQRLQVVAEVAVYVFMIVSPRQLAELPIEALVARVVPARGTPAVPAPIAEAFRISLERRSGDNVDCTAFTQRQVMRRIKRLRREIAPGTGGGG